MFFHTRKKKTKNKTIDRNGRFAASVDKNGAICILATWVAITVTKKPRSALHIKIAL